MLVAFLRKKYDIHHWFPNLGYRAPLEVTKTSEVRRPSWFKGMYENFKIVSIQWECISAFHWMLTFEKSSQVKGLNTTATQSLHSLPNNVSYNDRMDQQKNGNASGRKSQKKEAIKFA